MIDECVIFHPLGLGVCQRTLPVSKSTASKSASLPPGARITRPFSTKGHCPAYQGGVVAPNCRTKSSPHLSSPETASTHATWHLGPIDTTCRPETVGMVRDIP